MAYNSEKYRDKREKVLGVKSRGVSFGTLSTLFAVFVLLALGVAVVPKAVAYLSTRNLDDAIYKKTDSSTWSQEIVLTIDNLPGVRQVITDNHETRLVVTYNRLKTDAKAISSLLKNRGLNVDLLNTMDHRQRLSILEKEAEFEAL